MCGEVIDQSAGEFRGVRLRRRVLEPADRRLRGEVSAALGAATNGHFQRRIVAQRIVINTVLVAAAEAEHAGCDDLGQLMFDARRIAPIGQRCGHAVDDANLLLGRAQQQHARIQRLIAAIEINCELLAANRWQVEGKRRSVDHGRGVPLRRRHACLATVCSSDFNELRHGQPRIIHA